MAYACPSVETSIEGGAAYAGVATANGGQREDQGGREAGAVGHGVDADDAVGDDAGVVGLGQEWISHVAQGIAPLLVG
ncbi:hypothetical protein [Mariniluteicoccus flavus]